MAWNRELICAACKANSRVTGSVATFRPPRFIVHRHDSTLERYACKIHLARVVTSIASVSRGAVVVETL